MSQEHQSFASPKEIARWRAFGLIDGWEVAGTCDTEEDEIRLFDAPITDGFFAPSIRIQEVVCSRIIPGTLDGKEASEDIVRIRKGRLLATDSRFIAYNEVDHSAIFIWFDKIINVEYKNGDYLLTIDHHALIKERVLARPQPPQPFGMSDDEYFRNLITPIFQEASFHVPTSVLIRTKFPQVGLLDAAVILGAKSNMDRFWYGSMVQQKNQIGENFVSAFFYFLNEIADKNRFARR